MHTVCHQFVLSAWPLRVQLLVLPDAEPHLPQWLLQPPRTMVASGRTNSAFVQIAGLTQRVSHFCLNPDHGVSNAGNPTKEFQMRGTQPRSSKADNLGGGGVFFFWCTD